MSFQLHNLRRRIDHRGFSMVELVLVLAIVVVIASMAVAHLNGAYSSQYLKKGADRVRAEMGKARVRSMRTGDVYAFYYSPGGNQFAVGKYSDMKEIQMDDPNVNRGQFQFYDQLLPSDVFFSGQDVAWDSKAQFAEEAAQASGGGSVRPILFYGDGTSQNAKLSLSNKSGSSIQINLRGLTGLSSSSQIIGSE